MSRPAARRPKSRARPKSRPRRRATARGQRGLTARQRTLRRARRRRMLRRILLSAGAAVVVALAVLVPLELGRERTAPCIDDPATFPAAGIAGWSGEQLENAAVIMRTASALGYGRDGQIIGVMTAMGESSLRNIDYGDWETRGFTNPDGSRTTSIGLFQQQEWWGSVEQRMDPAASATLFYARLGRLAGWQQMEPSHAIHRVQINTDRDYYARYQADAVAVVDALRSGCGADDA